MKPGNYIATTKGYVFDRLVPENGKVKISAAFLKEHKNKHGKDFEASWLASCSSNTAVANSLEELRYEYQERFKEAPDGSWNEAKLKAALGK